MHTGLVTTPIVELWAQLQSAGYYKPGLLNLPADNALGSAGVDGLLKDTILFPGKALTKRSGHCLGYGFPGKLRERAREPVGFFGFDAERHSRP